MKTMIQTAEKLRIENDPIARKAERHEALLAEIAEDARELTPGYLKETVVPEGGE